MFSNPNRKRLSLVCGYAAAMAWVEAAVVFYLRTMVDRIEPYQEMPLPLVGALGDVELVREAATLIMLLTVGWLAGTSLRTKIAYAVMAFGVWDILYYVFLRIMCGWPRTLLDWDVLFLIPLPWWGPVIAPVAIAGLMIIWGAMVVFARDEAQVRVSWTAWGSCSAGILLALYVFMRDALKVADGGADALRQLLPTEFAWLPFGIALLLMSLPILNMLRNRARFGDARLTQGHQRAE